MNRQSGQLLDRCSFRDSLKIMARQPSRLRFTFIGWENGWYVLRLPTRTRPALDLHEYENLVLAWLIEQDITPNEQSYFANGNTGDGPVVPANGNALCLLLRRPADVLRFEREFGCRGVTPETMFAALRAEASVHKFVLADIAFIAYDAIRRLSLVFDEPVIEWGDLSRDEQQWFLQVIREYLEHPEWSGGQQHESWVSRRQLEGWRYAPEANLEQHLHPSIVPFVKLSVRDQARTRLTASVITSLMPLLGPR